MASSNNTHISSILESLTKSQIVCKFQQNFFSHLEIWVTRCCLQISSYHSLLESKEGINPEVLEILPYDI